MGSFYATCSISNITLTGQKTYIQLMYSRNNKKSFIGGLDVSNDAALVNYVPFGFPIEGEYYDYGEIENIVKNKNVTILEEYFGNIIENIIEYIIDSNIVSKSFDFKHIEILNNMAFTYFHKDVYDYLTTGWDKLSTKLTGQYDDYFARCWNSIKKIENFNNKDKDKLKELIDELTEKIRTETNLSKKNLLIRDMIEMKNPDYFTITSYIPRIYDSNFKGDFFTELKHYTIAEFGDDIKKQFKFFHTLGYELKDILKKSQYGSQQDNFKFLKNYNRKMFEIAKNDQEKYGYEEENLSSLRKEKLEKLLKKDFLKQEKESLLKRLSEIDNELEKQMKNK